MPYPASNVHNIFLGNMCTFSFIPRIPRVNAIVLYFCAAMGYNHCMAPRGKYGRAAADKEEFLI